MAFSVGWRLMVGFPGRAISDGAQFCLNTMMSRGVFPAHRTAFRSDLADLYMWQNGDSDPAFAQDASISGWSAPQRKFWHDGAASCFEGDRE